MKLEIIGELGEKLLKNGDKICDKYLTKRQKWLKFWLNICRILVKYLSHFFSDLAI